MAASAMLAYASPEKALSISDIGELYQVVKRRRQQKKGKAERHPRSLDQHNFVRPHRIKTSHRFAHTIFGAYIQDGGNSTYSVGVLLLAVPPAPSSKASGSMPRPRPRAKTVVPFSFALRCLEVAAGKSVHLVSASFGQASPALNRQLLASAHTQRHILAGHRQASGLSGAYTRST